MQHQELSLGGAVSAGTVIWDPLVENRLVVFPGPHTDTPAHTPLLYEYLPHLLPPGPFVRVPQQQPSVICSDPVSTRANQQVGRT